MTLHQQTAIVSAASRVGLSAKASRDGSVTLQTAQGRYVIISKPAQARRYGVDVL